jgi:hypothetical protein
MALLALSCRIEFATDENEAYNVGGRLFALTIKLVFIAVNSFTAVGRL